MVTLMDKDLAVVFDCGSTNLTVVVVDASGRIVSDSSAPNGPVRQPDKPADYSIWDVEGFWDRLANACRCCIGDMDTDRLCGVTVTTWGADGAPATTDGRLLYPPISWQDGRTHSLADRIAGDIDPWHIYQLSGYQIISFNTLLKLRWLHDNEPEILDRADHWLMMPGILGMLLSGKASLDATAAGTMMAMDMASRTLSSELLQWAGVETGLFPPLSEPGQIIGGVTAQAAKCTGLPQGLPVIVAGHDTQFAAVGSGATPAEVILSSGTWEILMLRASEYRATQQDFTDGLLIEADAEAGRYNPQLLMMGSGVIEWLRDQFFTDVSGREAGYGDMIAAAETIAPGSDGVTVIPSFVSDTGPLRRYETAGTVLGLKLSTTRDHLYRATLEGLSYQLRQALAILTRTSADQYQGLRVVGGGSKNLLWNQLRADVCGLPVTTIEQTEATVLGAAMFVFVGAGIFPDIAAAQDAMVGATQVFEPSENAAAYEDLFTRYATLPETLSGFYRQ
jgi:L-fuculokinase